MKFEKSLAKISKKLGINLVYLLKNGSWVSLRFFVLASGGWFVSLLFARIGTKELLGQYQYILALLSMISVVSLSGLNVAALESVVKGQEGGVIKAVKISFLASLIGVPIILGFAFYSTFFKGQAAVGETLFFAAFLFPAFYALNTWSTYYEGKSMFKAVSIRAISLNICLSLALALALFLKIQVTGLVLIFLGVTILFSAYYFKEVKTKIKDPTKDFIDVPFGIQASLQKFVLSLSGTIPPIAISFLFGIEWVAVYYIAFYLITAAFAFIGTLWYLYLPALFKATRLQHKHIFIQNLSVGLIMWAAFILFLKFFFILIYGESYRESLEIAYHISFLLFFIPLKTYLVNFFMTRRRNWMIIIIITLANLIGLSAFYATKGWDFSVSLTLYLYMLELLITLPLLYAYVQSTFAEKNTVQSDHKNQSTL